MPLWRCQLIDVYRERYFKLPLSKGLLHSLHRNTSRDFEDSIFVLRRIQVELTEESFGMWMRHVSNPFVSDDLHDLGTSPRTEHFV